MPFYERQPYIQPLHQVVKEVMEGEIRVPRFQRPGTEETWNPERRGDLLDSIYRGFPIGTILLWSANQKIRTMDAVGGFKIPSLKQEDSQQRLLLDGHQRLSTLVQLLGRALKEETNNQTPKEQIDEKECWFFELRPEKTASSRDRFILLKRGKEPDNTHLPINIILNRSELNKWIRDHSGYLNDKMIEEADTLRDKIREYSIPVAVLVTDSLQEATESFKRINSSGVRMNDFNMFSALSYNDEFDAQKIFEDYRSLMLEPIHWQNVSDLEILRICAGLVENHPATFLVEKLSKDLKDKKEIIELAFKAIERAAIILKRSCGIHGRRSLPYAWQLITIAIYLAHNADENKIDEEAIAKWFWLTTYGEVFNSFKDKTYDRSREALVSMIAGRSWGAMERDVTRKVEMISRFDFRAARSKACALCMARHQDEDDFEGDAHKALAEGVDSMGVICSKGQRSVWWHLAIATSSDSLIQYRNALALAAKNTDQEEHSVILKKLGFPDSSKGTVKELLEERMRMLIEKESEFIKELELDASALS
ncbi:MAG: hypothetical protein CDV28_11551 [Candidatus Electronema aureum]|uniref:GmrSD restriction endonucleases N-terminal domain-containing protein n=1 Tax=Candidatus Electronema aureum TaxID=2005002 RepID=A0A521G1N4_9BACT|nr:MAG: hypothetical protein CDV28_11551 [Candidatus Electronema aureum]